MEWQAVILPACLKGRLHELLLTLPRERWDTVCWDKSTMLHYACCGNNTAAAVVLIAHGLDINAANDAGWRPLHTAVCYRVPRMVEVLCAAGADTRVLNEDGFSPLDIALDTNLGSVLALLANGVRLSAAHPLRRRAVCPEHEAFERGVLRCRSVVVVLLGLKRRRGDVMLRVDRWVVRELCFAIWATRTNANWKPRWTDMSCAVCYAPMAAVRTPRMCYPPKKQKKTRAMRGLAGAVVLALVLSVGLAAAQNVTLSRTYFSDSFRLKATGMKVSEALSEVETPPAPAGRSDACRGRGREKKRAL